MAPCSQSPLPPPIPSWGAYQRHHTDTLTGSYSHLGVAHIHPIISILLTAYPRCLWSRTLLHIPLNTPYPGLPIDILQYCPEIIFWRLLTPPWVPPEPPPRNPSTLHWIRRSGAAAPTEPLYPVWSQCSWAPFASFLLPALPLPLVSPTPHP